MLSKKIRNQTKIILTIVMAAFIVFGVCKLFSNTNAICYSEDITEINFSYKDLLIAPSVSNRADETNFTDYVYPDLPNFFVFEFPNSDNETITIQIADWDFQKQSGKWLGMPVYDKNPYIEYTWFEYAESLIEPLEISIIRDGILEYFEEGETFDAFNCGDITTDNYMFIAWAKADAPEMGLIYPGNTVTESGMYYAILVKAEYFGMGFKTSGVPAVMFGFVLKVFDCGNNSDSGLSDNFATLLNFQMASVTFTVTTGENPPKDYVYYGNPEEGQNKLNYNYSSEYGGYVAQFVLTNVRKEHNSIGIEVDAQFAIDGFNGVIDYAYGEYTTIKEKAQEAYDNEVFEGLDPQEFEKYKEAYGFETYD